mgnify:CR=1 FL=1
MTTRNVESNVYDFRMNEIYNFNTGKIEQADYWLKQSPQVINKLKAAIQSNKKSYGCPFCKTPLVLKSGDKKHPHFSHARRNESVECVLCKEAKTQLNVERISFVKPKKEPVVQTWTSTLAYGAIPFFSSTATPHPYHLIEEAVQEKEKDYALMSDKEVVKLVFENKFSRTFIALKNRVSDLILEGYNFPKNLIEILELRGCVQKLTKNLSQVHYQKNIFES